MRNYSSQNEIHIATVNSMIVKSVEALENIAKTAKDGQRVELQDGGRSGVFYKDITKNDINDGGFCINGMVRYGVNPNVVHVDWFGAKGNDPTFDDTPYIQAAIDYNPNTILDTQKTFTKVVMFGRKEYYANNLQMLDNSNKTSLVGDTSGSSYILYNGEMDDSILPNNCILNLGNMIFGEIINIGFRGDKANLIFPKHLIYQVDGSYVDALFSLYGCSFANSWGDGVVINKEFTVNTFINNIRFDGIGGFCLTTGINTSNLTPFIVENFTVDSLATPEIIEIYRKFDGKVHNTNCNGEGIIRAIFSGNGGINIKLSNARIEMGLDESTDTPCLLYSDGLNGTNPTIDIELDTVVGYVGEGGSIHRDSPILYSNGTKGNLSLNNCNLSSSVAVYTNGNGKQFKYNKSSRIAHINSGEDTSPPPNLQLENNSIIVDRDNLLKVSNTILSPSDLILYNKPSIGVNTPSLEIVENSNHIDKLCSSNYNGHTVGYCNATVDSNIVSISSYSYTSLIVNSSILIKSAGENGNDLITYITNIDYSNSTININDAIKTSVDNTAIILLPCSRKDISQIRALQRFNKGQKVPITEDTHFINSRRGDISFTGKYYGTTTESWFPDAYRCIEDGNEISNGRWKVVGNISGTSTDRSSLETYLDDNDDIGVQFFDKDLGRPVYYMGGSNWIYSDGTAV